MKITRQELINKWFEFFESKGHVRIPSASVIPENDPSVLFTTAGMHPLVPYLLGQPHPKGKRTAEQPQRERKPELGCRVQHTTSQNREG